MLDSRTRFTPKAGVLCGTFVENTLANLTFLSFIAPSARTLALLLATAAMLSLAACGNAPGALESHAARLEISGFETYVASFESDAAEHGRAIQVTDLVIRFGAVDAGNESGGRGVCEFQSGVTPVITISAQAWEASSEAEREQLVFHELGHCVLHKRHEGGVSAQGIPNSLMNPYRIQGSVYLQHKAQYLAGLFAE